MIVVEAGHLSGREEDKAEAEHRGAVLKSADVDLGLAGPLSWRSVSTGAVDVAVGSLKLYGNGCRSRAFSSPQGTFRRTEGSRGHDGRTPREGRGRLGRSVPVGS